MNKQLTSFVILGALLAATIMYPGCQTRQQTGSAIGGAVGAGAGALLADNELAGALIGGAIGAGAGYIVADQTAPEKVRDRETAMNRHNQSTTGGTTSAAAGTSAGSNQPQLQKTKFILENATLNKRKVQSGNQVTAVSRVTILTPESQQRREYATFYQFVPENGKPRKMRKVPFQGPVESGTWSHSTTIRIRDLTPGKYDLRILLVNKNTRVKDSKRIPVTVVEESPETTTHRHEPDQGRDQASP